MPSTMQLGRVVGHCAARNTLLASRPAVWRRPRPYTDPESNATVRVPPVCVQRCVVLEEIPA